MYIIGVSDFITYLFPSQNKNVTEIKKDVDEIKEDVSVIKDETMKIEYETKIIEDEIDYVEKGQLDLKLELKDIEDKFEEKNKEEEHKNFFDFIGMSPKSTKSEPDLDYLVYNDDSEEDDFDENECGELIQKWSKNKKYRIQKCLWKLKYNRIISLFYLDNLRRKETLWSWRIVEISTVTSGLTVANNVDIEPIDHYKTIISISLTVLSLGTSLIAAWIKKQGFVEKINEIDKYLISINSLCEEIEVQFMLIDKDRLPYKEFKSKFIPEITKYVSSNPMIPPREWKQCAKEITLKYPQLIEPDNNEENKLWPWFGDLVQIPGEDDRFVRRPTKFMSHMLRKDKKYKIRSSCCFNTGEPIHTVYK